ncbi:MAG: choice-of-anchor E domain-containing protein [Phycisphaerales bacterium]|nr:choice-of-anchor E domain-containing protein [Phycisphaerales bacterium]
MKKMFLGAAAAAMVCAAGSAHAFIDSYSTNWGPAGVGPFNVTVSLPKFNDAGGTKTLQAVKIGISASLGADVTANNLSTTLPNDITISLLGSATATSALDSFSTTANISSSWGPYLGVAPLGQVGPNALSSGASNSGFTFPVAPYIAAFLGQTFNITVTGNGLFGSTGTTDTNTSVQNFLASGTVSVEYTWIPAPGAAALFGLAGLAGLRRRRA